LCDAPVLRAQGRTPGEEGRAAIALNRETHKHAEKLEKKYRSRCRIAQANLAGIWAAITS